MRTSRFSRALGAGLVALGLHSGCLQAAECKRNDASCDPLAVFFLYYAPFVHAPCQGAGTALASYFTFVAGGPNQVNDYALCATGDGGLLFAGGINTNLTTLFGKSPDYAYSGSTDILIAKLDSTGALSWYGYLGSAGAQTVRAVTETSDGSIFVAGKSDAAIGNLRGLAPLHPYQGSDDWILARLDSRGALQWFSFYGTVVSPENPTALAATPDGGVVIVGTMGVNPPALAGQTPVHPNSGGFFDFFAMQLDAAGQLAWHTFLGTAAATQTTNSIARMVDGGYVIGGSSDGDIPTLDGKTPLNAYLSGGISAGVTLKIGAAGALQWYAFLGGAGDEIVSSVVAMDNGDAVVAGLAQVDIPSIQGQSPINASTATEDFIVARYDPSGALRWYTFLGGGALDYGEAVVQTRNGGVVVGGSAGGNIPALSGKSPNNPYTTLRNVLLAQLDGAGRLEWYTFVGGSGGGAETGELVASRNGGFWLLGYSNSSISSLHGKPPLIPYTGITDMLLLKFKPDGVL